ncbi:MAG: hypothetical protein QOG86_724, partial [Thermoleophilaceae bacterium]|nr:hypothetical protein [Thermoleophilaceae bacterium]
VLIALQLCAVHWFYLYVPWFAPAVLVALFAAPRAPAPRPLRARFVAEPEPVLAPN